MYILKVKWTCMPIMCHYISMIIHYSHAIWKKDANNKTKIMELSIPHESALNYLTSGMHLRIQVTDR